MPNILYNTSSDRTLVCFGSNTHDHLVPVIVPGAGYVIFHRSRLCLACARARGIVKDPVDHPPLVPEPATTT